MTNEQWIEMIFFIDEHIYVEEFYNLTPRFKKLKQDLQATTINNLDWETIDNNITEMHKLFIREYCVQDAKRER